MRSRSSHGQTPERLNDSRLRQRERTVRLFFCSYVCTSVLNLIIIVIVVICRQHSIIIGTTTTTISPIRPSLSSSPRSCVRASLRAFASAAAAACCNPCSHSISATQLVQLGFQHPAVWTLHSAGVVRSRRHQHQHKHAHTHTHNARVPMC